MQRKRAPFWLKVLVLMAVVLGFFWVAGVLSERASFPVAAVLFLIALVVLAASEERT